VQNAPPAPLHPALQAVEADLAQDPQSLDLQLRRAHVLQCLGEEAVAKAAYLRVLQRDPDRLDALGGLAQLLGRTGFTSAARTLLERAVARHPHDLASHVNLAALRARGGDAQAAQALFEKALQIDPRCPQAHAGLSLVLDTLGQAEPARAHRQQGFGGRSVAELPYFGTGQPVRVLLLGATNAGNIPIERHLDPRVFRTWIVTPEFHHAGAPLPAHDLVFNAIGDADAAAAALQSARALAGRSAAPVINLPAAVAATGRCANWRRMADLPGVVVPRSATLARGVLAGSAAHEALARAGLSFPLLLRSPGYHTGEHFVLVSDSRALPAAVAALPGEELIAIEFLDVRNADGLTRKYRVMIVDGALHPLHLAVARRWKVHYFSADMAACAAHRDEEARFLADMPGALGARAMAALRAVAARLRLDYAGIDFSLDAWGRVVLFEANATMVVPEPGAEAHWDYRRAAVGRIDAAIRRMLLARAGAAGRSCASSENPGSR
jgi:Tfp pilus assembly protein PilF